jgi:hypothetical protein
MTTQRASAQFVRVPAAASTKAWVIVGALWFTLLVYCMASWVLGPDFVPNTTGRDQAPLEMVRFVRTLEVLMIALTAWLLYLFVFKPWWRDRRLSFDGLFFLACGALVLQEPWLNAIRPQLLYNTVFINYGSWLGHLPGIVSPVAEKVPVSLAFAGLGYFWIVAGPAYCGSRFMAWARARDPRVSALWLVSLCFLGFVVFDVLIESFILRTGMFIYPSTIPWLTLFAGKTYQFPAYEIVHWAGTYTALACIHFFRNDKGETWADRNFDTRRIPAVIRTFARWLAIMGLCQVAMLLTYNIPYGLWAFHGGPFTVSEETHPWLTAGLCGASTPYDCPGPGVPIARRDSPTNRLALPSASGVP